MRVGIIGTGSIGSMLGGLFASVPRLTVRVYNRSPEKALELSRHWDQIELSGSEAEVMRTCHVIFLCTKAADGRKVLDEFGPSLTPSQILATTISSIPMHELESATPALVVKVIPSITQLNKAGVCLISHGTRFDVRQATMFRELIENIGTPFDVEESQIRVASDLTSCGPAFLSNFLLRWAAAAAETGHLKAGQAKHLLCQMMMGVATLLENDMTLEEILARVAVPGGVTEAGLVATSMDADALFRHLHEATLAHVRPSECSIGGDTQRADSYESSTQWS